MTERERKFIRKWIGVDDGHQPLKKDLTALIKDEAQSFCKYFAERYNTERLDEDDIERLVPICFKDWYKQQNQK